MGGDRPQSHTRADSAICADCNWLITNCSLRSVAITYPRPNQAVNHRSGREAGHQRLARAAAHGRPGQQPGDPRSASVTTLGYDHRTMPGGARGTGRGTARSMIPAWPVLSVRFPVSSVQPARTAHGPVVMVRRRSTVRFRNGAPGRTVFRTTRMISVARLVRDVCSSHSTAEARRSYLAYLLPVVQGRRVSRSPIR